MLQKGASDFPDHLTPSVAIEVENLVKRYGKVLALNGVSFRVRKGELFALLGPNGAGKTTTIRILTCLTKPTSGRVQVFGKDLTKEAISVKRLVGLVPQTINLEPELTVTENLYIHGLLFGMSLKRISRKVEELLKFAELWDYRREKVRVLSGGMKRRLLIIRALLHDPKVLFMDEPTVGLDPHIRRKLWGLIKQIQSKGTTVVLTTHYIEEAEFLATRVAFMEGGRIVAVDAPEVFLKKLGKVALDVVLDGRLESFFFSSREEAEKKALEFSKNGYSVTLRRVNLEDAFLKYTGKRV